MSSSIEKFSHAAISSVSLGLGGRKLSFLPVIKCCHPNLEIFEQVEAIVQITKDFSAASKPRVLHASSREILRSVRDQILRVSGYEVTSCDSYECAWDKAQQERYDLVLIDVEGERELKAADDLCTSLKAKSPDQKIAFVCNWHVAIVNLCPDDVVRTEFDPVAFVQGVADVLRD